MKPIDSILQPTNGYINSFTRNTVEGWWELEIGLPKTWVYDENKDIRCEILMENEIGKLIKVSPKKQNVVIDDLIVFVEVIIETNKRIAEKEKQFTDRMQEMKSLLEKEAKKFYDELDELKVNSFKNLNDNFVKASHVDGDGEKKVRKPRTTKSEVIENAITETKTEPAIKIDQSRSA
jgi:hypothetical protein